MHARSTCDETYSRITDADSDGTGLVSRYWSAVDAACSSWPSCELVGGACGLGGVLLMWNSGTMERNTRRMTLQHRESLMRIAWVQKSSSGSTMSDCMRQNLRSDGYFLGPPSGAPLSGFSGGGSANMSVYHL